MTHHPRRNGADPSGGRHVPLEGVVHQPVDPATAPLDYLPGVIQRPGHPPVYGPPTVVVIQPPQPARAGMGPIGARLLIGAGIGAAAVLAVTLVGSLLLATLQALAMTALAVGGMALALAVAAVALGRSLNR